MANYTVAIEGSDYVARNSLGTIVATSTNFVTMMNALNAYVSNGDRVTIAAGNYTANNKITWDKTGTIIGASLSAKIINGAYTAGTNFQMSKYGTDITIDTLTFDNNSVNSGYAPLQLGCPNGIVQNCSFLNIIQYNMLTYAADNFHILNSTVNKAQYGISTGGDVTTGYCTNGLIQGNIISDCKDDGIKIRWCDGVIVELNNVDVNPTSWATPYTAPCGVGFAGGDGPAYDVTVQNNHFYNTHLSTSWVLSGVTIRPVGVMMGPDVPGSWGSPTPPASSGLVVTGNLIEWMYNGVSITSLTGVTVTNNKFMHCATDINNGGVSTVITGNLYDTSSAITGVTKRKMTTSSNIGAGAAIMQGFSLAVSEICYSEQGGTVTIGAVPVAGYTLSKFTINGVDHAPVGGEYDLVLGAMDYTVVVVYTLTSTTTTTTSTTSTTSTTTNPPPAGGIMIFMEVHDPDTSIGQHPAVTLADGITEIVYHQIYIPSNFTSLVAANIILVPANTGNMVWQVATTWGQVGVDDYNTHTDSIGASVSAVTINDLTPIDISAALTGIAATDLVGITFQRTGGSGSDTVNAAVYYLGIELNYT